MSGKVVCVGTSNVDIQGFASSPVIAQDKNPEGTIEVWAGGVARNIGENLARWNIPVTMLTAVGDDAHAEKILNDSIHAGIEMTHVLKLQDCRSGAYISITDTDGDLFVGLTDMSIASEMTVEYFRSKQFVLENADILVLSPCVSLEVIGYLCRCFKDKPIFVDVVSKGYVPRLSEYLGHFHTIKANLYEAEELSGIRIESTTDLIRAADSILENGVQRAVISLGKDGLLYKDSEGAVLRKRTKEVTEMVNAAGAGDALAAGLVYGYIKALELEEMLEFAMIAAVLTIQHKNTINPDLTPERVFTNVEEWKC